MATNWEAKFGKGKWVTVRGARVYIQEGKGLGAALQKLAGKKKTIKSPERKIPKLDDSAKKIIGKNEKTIVTAKQSYRKAISSNNLDDSHKAYVALGKAENAQSINRELKGRNREPDLIRKTGAADYNNAQKKDSENAWVHDGHMASVKAGIKTARAAREAAGTNGKLRSPVYADQKTGKLKLASKPLGKGTKTFTNEKDREAVEKGIDARTVKRNEETIKNVRKDPNAIIKPIKTSKARIAIAENSAIKRKNQPGRGEWQNSYDQLNAGDSTVANAFSKKTNRYPKIQQYEVKNNIKEAQAARKRHGTEGKLRSDVYKSAPAMTPKAETAKKQKPVAQEKSGEVKKINLLGDLKNREDQNKALFTAPIDKNGRLSLGNGSALRYGKGELKFREAADALKSGKTTGSLEEKILTGKIKNGKLVNKDGTTITISKHDLEMRKAYDAVKKENKTPSLKSALQEKVGKKTRKK